MRGEHVQVRRLVVKQRQHLPAPETEALVGLAVHRRIAAPLLNTPMLTLETAYVGVWRVDRVGGGEDLGVWVKDGPAMMILGLLG